MFKIIFVVIILQALFLIPSYFLYKKILIKKKVKEVKKYSLIATLLTPTLVILLTISICYGIVNPILRSKEFNSKDWIENEGSRYRMVNDLKENKLLVEKNRKEVIELLGEEYTTDCWTKNTICYVAPDPENYAILDHYVFVVFFNENNKVEYVKSINR